MTPAVYAGAGIVALGSLAAFGIRRHRQVEADVHTPVPARRQRTSPVHATSTSSQT
jgi:hypothetical protein